MAKPGGRHKAAAKAGQISAIGSFSQFLQQGKE